MEDALIYLSRNAAIIADAMALVVIAFGTIEAFVGVIRYVIHPGSGSEQRRSWLRYARWLVAGLTFQLAADILETAVTPTWDDIGKLAAIAAIRTGLNFFPEKDVGGVRETDAAPRPAGSAGQGA